MKSVDNSHYDLYASLRASIRDIKKSIPGTEVVVVDIEVTDEVYVGLKEKYAEEVMNPGAEKDECIWLDIGSSTLVVRKKNK